ncbi:MAG: ATP12 family chaperone protein [Alphaproteobacteria bacterium]
MKLPRRFYTNVELAEEGDLYVVSLDGRRAKTPGRAPLGVSDRAIGEALTAEWEAQAEVIDPAAMPLTRIVNSSIDGVSKNMDEACRDIAAYAGNDLLCYRADGPEGLVARQTAAWDPLLGWLIDEYGVRLQVGTGVLPLTQSDNELGRIVDLLAPFEALPLTAAHVVTTLTGSAVLGLSVALGRQSPEEAWSAAHIDEDWQIDQWGAVPEAGARRESRWREMAAAALILRARSG